MSMRLGLTQRVVVVPEYGERRDCLDQAWTDLTETCGGVILPLANRIAEVPDYLRSLDLDGLILTGGNDLSDAPQASDKAPERDRFERAAVNFCLEQGLPVLGVCRGLQLLNLHFGGTLERVADHAGIRHQVIPQEGNTWFDPAPFEVNSYHNFTVQTRGLSDSLKALACTGDGGVEAFEHTHLPILAMMWHPEREAPFLERDIQMIRKHLSGTRR
jgi:N5-(cytidine 5'-diphosphoramidyl)-L-glutamine hydrolase